MKSLKTKFYDKLSIDELEKAYYRASKHRKNKKEVAKFSVDLENNLYKIYEELVSGYKVGKYNSFLVHDPKERTILSLPFKDRIIHQWYVENFIKPYYLERFIYDSYACIKGKGTHSAIKRLKFFLNKIDYDNYYVIKCDIKKYFYNVDKAILFDILARVIKDDKLLDITKTIIFDNSSFKGIPIGNYTSQYFANIYLNELDYYVKFDLKIKYYIRYMDDFIFLVPNKDEAKEVFLKVKSFLENKLLLELNLKSRYYKANRGIAFCGYRVFKDFILISRRSKKKVFKNVKKWNKLYFKKKLHYKKFLHSYNSFLGHLSHCDSYFLIKKINSKIIFLKIIINFSQNVK